MKAIIVGKFMIAWTAGIPRYVCLLSLPPLKSEGEWRGGGKISKGRRSG